MPDISMCSGEGCPRRETCYRALVKPSERQYWFTVPPNDGDECEYYWPKEARDGA